jgi:hypothetical protein
MTRRPAPPAIRRTRNSLFQSNSLAVVAFNNGFRDQSHFTIYFNKLPDVTPGQYLLSAVPQSETDFSLFSESDLISLSTAISCKPTKDALTQLLLLAESAPENVFAPILNEIGTHLYPFSMACIYEYETAGFSRVERKR